jgi:hypothetical protein
MAEPSEATPFLSENDRRESHDEREDDYVKPTPANMYFEKPVRIFAAVISLLSLGIGGLLIACCVLVKVGPFENTWGTGEAARDLAICVSTPIVYFFAIGIQLLTVFPRPL